MAKKIDEAAVWQRVTAASRSAGPEAPVHQPVSPEILELISTQKGRAAAYGRLYRQTGKSGYAGLYRQEKRGAAKLSGIYYLMTGQPPKTSGTAVSGTGKALLRQLLNSEETSAGRLEALAERSGGETAAALEDLSRQARRHWGMLLELLGADM